MFAITDEREIESSNVPPSRTTAQPFVLRQTTAAVGPLLWAADMGNLMLTDWNTTREEHVEFEFDLPELSTRADRLASLRRGGSDEVVRVITTNSLLNKSEVLDKNNPPLSSSAFSASMISNPPSFPPVPPGGVVEFTTDVWDTTASSNSVRIVNENAFSGFFDESSASKTSEEDPAYWSDWDFESDGKLQLEREGGCSELCCELPVGDAECAENVKKGVELIESFRTMGITFGNVLSYNALLDMCALAANEQTTKFANYALSLLAMMRDNRVAPNADSYSGVIRSCCHSREGLFKALLVLQEMRKAGFELPRPDYLRLVDACAKEAQRGNGIAVEQGLAVLETMCKANLVPDPNRCLALISVVPRKGVWCNFCRDKIIEIMQESGLDNQSVRQAMDLVRDLNT